MEKEVFEEALAGYREFCQSYLKDWRDQHLLTDFLKKIPEEALHRLERDEPQTIRISFLTRPISTLCDNLYFKRQVLQYPSMNFPEGYRDYPDCHDIIEKTFREEAKAFFAENPPDHRSASIQVGNITLVADEIPRDSNEKLNKTQAELDEAIFHGSLIPSTSKYGQCDQLVQINNNTILTLPDGGGEVYPAEHFLTRNFAELVVLADSYEKIRQRHNENLPSKILFYSAQDVVAVSDSNNILFGDEYLRAAQTATAAFTEDILGHEFGHIINGDTNPDSPQRMALSRLDTLCGPHIFGIIALQEPEKFAKILLAATGSLESAMEKLAELDSLFEKIAPAVKSAAEHMESFHQFETFYADNVAEDMQRNNRFVQHVLDIPVNEKDIQEFQSIANLEIEFAKAPDASFDDETVDKAQNAVNALAEKHGHMLDEQQTLDFCRRHISQAKEICADLHAAEIIENPKTLPKFFTTISEASDKHWVDTALRETGKPSLPPSHRDNATHPAHVKRHKAAQSYAQSIQEMRGSPGKGRG